MFAIIEAQGKQYLVQEGSIIKLNGWLPQEEEEVVVTGKVVKKGKDKKVVVFKYKPKVNYRKKTGHRQPLTLVSIEKIEGE